MNTFILNLSDSRSVKLVYHTTFLKEISIICKIPIDTKCVKVIGIVDFSSIIFDKKFYNAFKGEIEIFDLSELESTSSYSHLRLGLNNGLENHIEGMGKIKELILPNALDNMPMIRNLSNLRKITGLGLGSFNNESKTDYISDSNLSNCPKLEEIVFGSNIKTLSIRNSSLKKIHIPNTNSSLQLEPYAFAYNKELEEVHIPQDIKELPIRLFEGCNNLRTITGGNNIEEIGFGAFGGCINLHSVPFRVELLTEDQFVSYDKWMQYAPIGYKTSSWNHGDCESCPKGRWTERRNEWEAGCNYIKNYCRDNDLRKWKPYKKGVVLRNGYIWCFDDYTYYKIAVDTELIFGGESKNTHKYVEFISPNITFTSEGNHTNINHTSPFKKAIELTYPNNNLADMIDLYYTDISYELIWNEIMQEVDKLDIETIIDSYKTTFRYETYRMNSDTEGERYTLNRDAKYTDKYLASLLPPIHKQGDDRIEPINNRHIIINPNKRFDFESCLSTYNNKEQRINHFDPSNIVRDAENLKNSDEDVRREARKKYCRKDHVDFLVNCRISEIINKKLEIESRLHLRQAENDSYGLHK